MTDIETAIMIKKMAREMVRAKLGARAKNAAGRIDKATAKKIVDELVRAKSNLRTATDRILGSGYFDKMGFDEHENLLFEMKSRNATGKNADDKKEKVRALLIK